MPKKSGSAENKIIEVTETELADILGLSDRRIRVLAKDGIIYKTKPARYDLKKSVKGYIDFIRDTKKEEKQGVEKIKLAREAEGLMHDKLKKRKTELQILQMEKELLYTKDVISMWTDFATMVKSKLLNIPTKLAPQLVGLEDATVIKKTIGAEVTEALNEIADFDINKFEKNLYFDEENEEAENGDVDG